MKLTTLLLAAFVGVATAEKRVLVTNLTLLHINCISLLCDP